MLVFLAIVLSSGSGGGGGGQSTGSGSRTADTSTAPARDRTTTQPKKQAATYTVKVGDTLGSIAETTGVPVEKLLELNPDLDPAGARVRAEDQAARVRSRLCTLAAALVALAGVAERRRAARRRRADRASPTVLPRPRRRQS